MSCALRLAPLSMRSFAIATSFSSSASVSGYCFCVDEMTFSVLCECLKFKLYRLSFMGAIHVYNTGLHQIYVYEHNKFVVFIHKTLET